jgi:hypothetical protein
LLDYKKMHEFIMLLSLLRQEKRSHEFNQPDAMQISACKNRKALPKEHLALPRLRAKRTMMVVVARVSAPRVVCSLAVVVLAPAQQFNDGS